MATSVLIVEDESIVALDIKRRLEASSFDVFSTVGTGADALAAVSEHIPDVILMDIQIRGDMDGIETAQRIQGIHHIPIIFLTAFSDRESIDRAKLVSSYGYLLKPFQERELAIAIELALYKSTVERELHRNRTLLDSTLNGIVEGVVVSDTDGNVLLINKSAERMLELSENEAVGKPFSMVFISSGLDDESDSTVSLGWRVIHRRSGTSIPIEMRRTTYPEKDPSGISSILVFRDITGIRQYERQLIAAREAAIAADEAKSQFLANMSHELRTPLNSIIGMTELALESDPSSQLLDYLTTLRSSADDLLNMINGILDHSGFESGHFRLRRDPISVRDIIERIVVDQAPAAHKKGLQIYFKTDPSVPLRFLGDEDRIRHIVSNLVNNAIKFTESGSVFVELRAEFPQSETANVHVIVRDTGTGIPNGKIDSIFESFVQVDGSRTRTAGGVGLGLAIVDKLLKEFGGSISVSSTLHSGSNFHIELPLEILEKGQGEEVPTEPILIVAGNPLLAEVLDPWVPHRFGVEVVPIDTEDLQRYTERAQRIVCVVTERELPKVSVLFPVKNRTRLVVVIPHGELPPRRALGVDWLAVPLVLRAPLGTSEVQDIVFDRLHDREGRNLFLTSPDEVEITDAAKSKLETLLRNNNYKTLLPELQRIRAAYEGEISSLMFRLILAIRRENGSQIEQMSQELLKLLRE